MSLRQSWIVNQKFVQHLKHQYKKMSRTSEILGSTAGDDSSKGTNYKKIMMMMMTFKSGNETKARRIGFQEGCSSATIGFWDISA